MYKCLTIRRRVDADAYDEKCLENITIDFNEYMRKGAATLRTAFIREDAKDTIVEETLFEEACEFDLEPCGARLGKKM